MEKTEKILSVLTNSQKETFGLGDYLRIISFLPNLKYDKIYWISDKKVLEGLPDNSIEAAKLYAEKNNRPDEWCFTLDTNIGILLLKYPEIKDQIEKVVLVAGRRKHTDHFGIGNKGVYARDLNFDLDNDAFRILLESGVKIVLCPFEISSKVWIKKEDLKILEKGDTGNQWIAEASAGLALAWEDWQVTYAAVQRTREFEGQDEQDKFGARSCAACAAFVNLLLVLNQAHSIIK